MNRKTPQPLPRRHALAVLAASGLALAGALLAYLLEGALGLPVLRPCAVGGAGGHLRHAAASRLRRTRRASY